MDWPSIVVPKDIVDEFKKRPSYRNNNCGKDPGTRHFGDVGEWAFEEYVKSCRAPIERVNDYEKDFMFNGGHRLDAKCMVRTVDPRPEYGATVFDSQYQRSTAHLFAWIFVNVKTLRCFMVGWISKQIFDEKKILRKAGIPVTESYTPTVDTWEIPVSGLWRIERLVESWKPK